MMHKSFKAAASMARAMSASAPQMPSFAGKRADKFDFMSKDKQFEVRDKQLVKLATYYKKPICIVEGKGQYLFDDQGKRYLDMIAGIVTVSVGHCHPHVNEALRKQSERLWHLTSIYAYPGVHEYAEKLLEKFPKGYKVAFTNSGSEANDLAVLLSRCRSGNTHFISLRNGYHGMGLGPMGLTNLSTWKYNTPHGAGMNATKCPDPYRSVHGGTRTWHNTVLPCPKGHSAEAAAQAHANELKETIMHDTSGQIAGFIAEYVQGVGGGVQLADGYLKKAYEIVRQHGGFCVSDEVQTGFGRLGTHFWAWEKEGVVPDIITMAKGIGNGFPMAAVVCSPTVAEAMGQRTNFNTFGGNPLASAVGMAVLEVIEKDKLQENALVVGGYLGQKLTELKNKYEFIGDVRGGGLMWGVEFVKDKVSKTPFGDAAADVFERAKDMGVLVGKGGLYGHSLRIKPPMCISKADVDFTFDVLDKACEEASRTIKP